MTISPPSLVGGLRPADPAFESWWVRPGAATVVELFAGDRVTVIDPDGGQPAELTVLAPDGRDDPGALGRGRRRPGRRAAGHGGERRRERLPGRAACARAAAPRRAGAAAVRSGRRTGRVGVVRLRARRAAGGGRSRRAPRGRRPAGLGARDRAQAGTPAARGRAGAAAAAGRAAARLPGGQGVGAGLRGARGRVHPDHRRAGQAVLGLPRLPRAQAAEGRSSAAWTA